MNNQYTNPDQPVQPNEMVNQPAETHEEIEHYPITKDNIVEVLEYNNYKNIPDHCLGFNNNKIYYSSKKMQDNLWIVDFNVGVNVWLPLIESVTGKLKPLLKPKFDFVKYLLDNGFTKYKNYNNLILQSINGLEIKYSDRDGIWIFSGLVFSPTEANAKIVVQMAKLAQELL